MAVTDKRRTDRVFITLPVSISGTDAAGQPFSEDTTTVTVSQHGASMTLKTEFGPGQEITVRRLRTRVPHVAECLVVGQTGKQGGLQVFSVAFRKPAVGFWDVYFPSLPPDQGTAGRALLECKVCATRRVVHLDSLELEVYSANRQLSLRCDKCGKSTIWSESQQETARQIELAPANPTRLAGAPSPPANNQRKHRRVAAEIPACVRQAGSDDEVATTIDISRGGLRFTSRRHYATGSYIQVAVPYSSRALNVFVNARTAHSCKTPNREIYQFGIMYLAENEPSS